MRTFAIQIVRKGVIQHGQIVVSEPINLPDGSEVTITGYPHGEFVGEEDNDRSATEEEIAAKLASLGRPIGVIDIMIAAIARTLGNCTVVSADNDLRSVLRLTVENWTT